MRRARRGTRRPPPEGFHSIVCSRTNRDREAPSARRTANSGCRALPRARIRFARFVQATMMTGLADQRDERGDAARRIPRGNGVCDRHRRPSARAGRAFGNDQSGRITQGKRNVEALPRCRDGGVDAGHRRVWTQAPEHRERCDLVVVKARRGRWRTCHGGERRQRDSAVDTAVDVRRTKSLKRPVRDTQNLKGSPAKSHRASDDVCGAAKLCAARRSS